MNSSKMMSIIGLLEINMYFFIWYCIDEDPYEFWQFTERSYVYYGYVKYNHYILFQNTAYLDNGTRGDLNEFSNSFADIGKYYYRDMVLYAT